MRTDGQPKGQPRPGRGRHRVSLTGPGTPSTLGQRSPTEGDRELWRPLETQPPQQQPPRDTGQKEPGPEPCPGPRVPGRAAHSGQPPPTTPGTPKTGQGRTLWSRHQETQGSDSTSRGCSPPPAPTPQQHPRWVHRHPHRGHFLSLRLPSHPQDTPICQGTRALRQLTQGGTRACVLLRLAPLRGAQAACQSSGCAASAQPRAELLTAGGSGACRTAEEEAALEESQSAGPSTATQQPWAQRPCLNDHFTSLLRS